MDKKLLDRGRHEQFPIVKAYVDKSKIRTTDIPTLRIKNLEQNFAAFQYFPELLKNDETGKRF